MPEELDALRGGHAEDLGVGAAFVGEADDTERQVLALGVHEHIMHGRGQKIDRRATILLDGLRRESSLSYRRCGRREPLARVGGGEVCAPSGSDSGLTMRVASGAGNR